MRAAALSLLAIAACSSTPAPAEPHVEAKPTDAPEAPATPERPGPAAPPLVAPLANTGGGEFDLHAMQQPVVVVSFYWTGCGPCQETWRHLAARGDRDVRYVGVLAVYSPEHVARDVAAMEAEGLAFPVIADLDETITPAWFSEEVMPSAVVVNAHGEIVARFEPVIEDELDAAIDAL